MANTFFKKVSNIILLYADPSFTLSRLVRLVYSSDPQKRSAASSAVEAVLQGHSDQGHTVTVLLDCIRCVRILSFPANYFRDDLNIVI